MDGTTLGRLLAAGAVALAAATGCTQTVPGSPVAATAGPRPAAAPPSPAAEATSPAAPAPPRSSLASDVVDDECLLDAARLEALVGRPVGVPATGTVDRPGGPAGTSCVARAPQGGPALVAANVYAPREDTPAAFVRAAPPAGRRDLPGVGEAAVVLDTAAGPTLQLAGERYVVTIIVFDGAPSDDAWRAAAEAALARL